MAELQPKDGAVILACAHAKDVMAHHFFYTNQTIDFVRPDGSKGQSSWIVMCDACFQSHSVDVALAVKADYVWRGDTPCIESHW